MDETTIISDIHLGSENCQAKLLSRFLYRIKERTKKLILAGDVFDSIDFRRLNKHHWHVLSELRKASKDMEVIWIAGNHDGPAEIVSHMIGVPVFEEYVIKSGGKRILILHGHRFDKFVVDHPFLTWLGDTIYSTLQKVDKSHYWARMVKSSSKQYLRCTEIVKRESVKHAYKNGYDLVCCAHTHTAAEDPPYYNSGCWTETPCTYLVMNDGCVKLNVYSHEVDDAD